MPELTYDGLVDSGIFQVNHLTGEGENGSFGGLLFETFGPELDYVKSVAREFPDRVATIIEAEGNLYLCRGFHFVNRIGYFIATKDLPDLHEGLALDDEPESEEEPV